MGYYGHPVKKNIGIAWVKNIIFDGGQHTNSIGNHRQSREQIAKSEREDIEAATGNPQKSFEVHRNRAVKPLTSCGESNCTAGRDVYKSSVQQWHSRAMEPRFGRTLAEQKQYFGGSLVGHGNSIVQRQKSSDGSKTYVEQTNGIVKLWKPDGRARIFGESIGIAQKKPMMGASE